MMNFKNKALLVLLLLFSSCLKKNSLNNCNNKLFPKSGTLKNGVLFVFDSTTTVSSKNDVCFYRYSLYSTIDSIIGYWGKRNDTLVFISDSDFKFKRPFYIPFLPLKAKTGSMFKYYDYNQVKDDVSYLGDLIEVEIMNISVTKDDTIYYLRHSARNAYIADGIPGDTTNINPISHRFFEISMKEGIVKYDRKGEGNVSKLKFRW